MSMRNAGAKLPTEIVAEASEWFVDFREGGVTPRQRRLFNAWLRRSPEHIRAYLEIAAFWTDVSVPAGADIDVDGLIAQARATDTVVTLERRAVPEETSRGNGRWALRPTSLVASVVLAGILALLTAWYVTQRGVTYVTGIGERRSVLLADGSTVDLNARTRVRVRFSEQAREIRLIEGQALFKVVKDPMRPFIVHSDDARIRAIGTEFDVYRRRTGTTVTVLEGRVAVVSQRASPAPTVAVPRTSASPAMRTIGAGVEVVAGERMKVATAGAVEAPEQINMTLATAWTRQQIIFQRAPLTDVVEEFNRYNQTQMVIADPSIGAVRITGMFSSTKPRSLLLFLRELPMFTVLETDAEIRITRKEPLEKKSP